MFKRRQEEWRRPIWPEIEKYLWWAAILVVLAWSFYELYTLMLYVNLVWVNNETWRLPGWYGFTIHALTRFTGFGLGIIWLGVMIWSEQHLDTALKKDNLRPVSKKVLLYSAGLGVLCLALLRILPWLWGIPVLNQLFPSFL